jgi:hypothetical protein
MAWFDDPHEYYREGLDDTVGISQGDIVIGPTAVIVHGTAETDVAAPADLDIVREVTLWRSAEEVDLPGAPSLAAQVRWGLAMVLPHPCALEKERNEVVHELTSAGTDLQAAKAKASGDPELDRYVAIAPVRAYDGMPDARAAPIARGDALGSFPIVARGDMPATYVDFSQISTVRWELLSTRQRVAGLSELAVAHLRHRLATYFAYRAKSKLGTVEAAVGQRIVEVNATPTNRKLTVSLILENGTTLVLEGDRRPDAPPGPERPARG